MQASQQYISMPSLEVQSVNIDSNDNFSFPGSYPRIRALLL